MKIKNIGIFGDNTLGNKLGKKGTHSDITFYSTKQDESALSFVEPTDFPDKIQTVIYAINLTDAALLKIDAVTRMTGELIIGLDCAGVKKGFIVLGENLVREQLAPILKGTCLENYDFIDNDRIKILEHLFKADIPRKEGSTKIQIDHFFDVKGVGTVILGTLRGGLKKFDEFVVYPTAKKTMVKSIQIYDRDSESAGDGNRVGLSLKGIKYDEVTRGYVLAKENSMMVKKEIETKFKVQKFWKYPLCTGNEYVSVCGLQQVRAKIKEIREGEIRAGDEGTVTMELDKDIAYEKGDKIFLLRPDLPDNRIVGAGEII